MTETEKPKLRCHDSECHDSATLKVWDIPNVTYVFCCELHRYLYEIGDFRTIELNLNTTK